MELGFDSEKEADMPPVKIDFSETGCNANIAVHGSKKIAIFYGKSDVYVVIYKGKDKNTTQVIKKPAEPVGSPVAPLRCK